MSYPEKDNKILSKEEVNKLNSKGYNLDPSRLYIFKFLFNDKPNKSGDPISFTIDTNALEKIAKSGIGFPYVFNPGIKNNKGAHVRGEDDDPKKIIEFQKKYALGIMKAYHINPISKNAYTIIEVFPEYEQDVLAGKIRYQTEEIDSKSGAAIPITQEIPLPNPTSTLIEPIKWQNGKLVDGRLLHLMAVDNPGYPMELASISGACHGMFDECAANLTTLGSSMKLKEFQKNFSYTPSTIGSSMAMNPPGNGTGTPAAGAAPKEMSLAELTSAVTKLQENDNTILTQMKQMMDMMGADSSADKGTPAGGKPATMGSAGTGAAGQQLEKVEVTKEYLDKMQSDLKEVKTSYEKTKKELDAEKAKVLMEARIQLAKIIVNGEIALKKIPEDKMQERIKHYVELVDENTKEPKDLSLLADAYKGMEIKTVGSASFIELPEMNSDKDVNVAEIMEKIG